MTVVTVKVVALLVALMAAPNPVLIVNMIGLLTDLNAVIQPGMNMVLTVLI